MTSSLLPSVCTFKTSSCVPEPCAHVSHMWACCQYTRRRFECTHGGVADGHTEFSACHTTHHTPHNTTPRTTHHTPHTHIPHNITHHTTQHHTPQHTTTHHNTPHNTTSHTHNHLITHVFFFLKKKKRNSITGNWLQN